MFLYLLSATYQVVSTGDNGSPGTFRWAIDQANASPGPDTITFNIPDTDPGYVCSSGNCWWRITLTSKLPIITDPVLIDGWSQTANRGNTNLCHTSYRAAPDSAGWTGVRNSYPRTVGTLGATLPYFPCPEVEIDLNGNSSISGMLEINASDVLVRGIAFFNGGGSSGSQVIRVKPGSHNVTLRELFVGLPADGSEPVDSSRSDCVFVDDGTSGKLSRLYVGFCGSHGVKFGNTSATTSSGWVMDSSEIFASAWYFDQGDNVNVYFSNVTLRHNLIHSSNNPGGSDIRVFGAGIEVRYDADTTVITENTVYGNGTKGVFVDGGSDYVEISYNRIYGNGWNLPGPGVGVGEKRGISTNVLITRNYFSDNGGLAIDLDSSGASGSAGDGVTCNDGLRQTNNPNVLIDYPYLDSAKLYVSSGDTTLLVWGRAYTGADSVEVYVVSTLDSENCPGEVNGHGEGGTFLTAVPVVLNSFNVSLKVDSLGPDWGSGSLYLTALSRDNLWNTSEFSENLPVPLPVGSSGELVVHESGAIDYTYGEVEVYDPSGRLVYRGNLKGFRGSRGVYFVVSGGKVVRKIVR